MAGTLARGAVTTLQGVALAVLLLAAPAGAQNRRAVRDIAGHIEGYAAGTRSDLDSLGASLEALFKGDFSGVDLEGRNPDDAVAEIGAKLREAAMGVMSRGPASPDDDLDELRRRSGVLELAAKHKRSLGLAGQQSRSFSMRAGQIKRMIEAGTADWGVGGADDEAAVRAQFPARAKRGASLIAPDPLLYRARPADGRSTAEYARGIWRRLLAQDPAALRTLLAKGPHMVGYLHYGFERSVSPAELDRIEAELIRHLLADGSGAESVHVVVYQGRKRHEARADSPDKRPVFEFSIRTDADWGMLFLTLNAVR